MSDNQLAAPEQVRAMLYRKVDDFIAMFEGEGEIDEVANGTVTLDAYAIVAVCSWPDPDEPEGDKMELSAGAYSTRNLFTQLGMMEAIKMRIQARMGS